MRLLASLCELELVDYKRVSEICGAIQISVKAERLHAAN